MGRERFIPYWQVRFLQKLCVDRVSHVRSGYGLWLSSTPIPDHGDGYADLTSWFEITKLESDDSVDENADLGL